MFLITGGFNKSAPTEKEHVILEPAGKNWPCPGQLHDVVQPSNWMHYSG